jgi:hypothetical protein
MGFFVIFIIIIYFCESYCGKLMIKRNCCSTSVLITIGKCIFIKSSLKKIHDCMKPLCRKLRTASISLVLENGLKVTIIKDWLLTTQLTRTSPTFVMKTRLAKTAQQATSSHFVCPIINEIHFITLINESAEMGVAFFCAQKAERVAKWHLPTGMRNGHSTVCAPEEVSWEIEMLLLLV